MAVAIRFAAGGFFVALCVTGSGGVAEAANGDLVHTTNFSIACPNDPNFAVGGIGVGVTFDGQYLWYSCRDVGPDLHKADPLTGAVIQSFNVRGGLGALAWDGKRKKLWAGWGGGSSAVGDIILIDPSTGVGTTAFNAAAAATQPVCDGIALDSPNDILYVSPDVSPNIFRYQPNGTQISGFPWNGASTGCGNSGLSVGGHLVFEGSDGCNTVFAVDMGTTNTMFSFATGSVRDEGMTCDDITFSPKTVIWSVEAFEPRRAFAFEIPAGSCGFGGGVDTDGDGLLDSWEQNGVYIQPNGVGATQFVNLPAMGADPNKPDVFVHLDWLQDNTHNTSIPSAWIQDLVNAFANSPHVSPNNVTGINLHVDHGPNSILNFNTMATWGNLSHAQSFPWVQTTNIWTDVDTNKTVSFTPFGRTPIFHYALLTWSITQGGGASRGLPASDFVSSNSGVNNFCDATCNRQYVTTDVMHELGHNLGLNHGGNEATNRKPNYLSVMSYNFGQSGLEINGTFGHYDYSRQALPSLNEANLTEANGVSGAPAGYGTARLCPGVIPVPNASGPIDWDCDGNTTGVGINHDINGDGMITVLNGFNDWPALVFNGGAIGAAGFAPVLPSMTPPEPNFPPHIQLPGPQTAGYSDAVSFTVYVGDPEATDNIKITVDNLIAGLVFTPDNVNRFATVTGSPLVPSGVYPITFIAEDGFNPPILATLNLTVALEDAVVTPLVTNPESAGVTAPGGTSVAFTLGATIQEAADDATQGDISNAVPVTYALTPLDGGASFTCTAATSGGGVGGTLFTSCAFSGIPVNAYNLTITIGGGFYQGSANAIFAVFDPSLGSVSGGGTVLNNGVVSSFAIEADYLSHGALHGSLSFDSHGSSPPSRLESTSLESLSIVGDRAYVIGRASLNGSPGYSFILRLVGSDQLGLEVRDPSGALVPGLDFGPTLIRGGNLRVAHTRRSPGPMRALPLRRP